MAQKIVITKAGYDAASGTVVAKDKIFDSSLNHLKTFSSGSFSQSLADNATYLGTLTHNLGYHPLSIAYFTESGDTSKYKITMSAAPSANPTRYSVSDVNVSMYCGTAKTIFKLYNNAGVTRTITVKYELFYEGA